jgi:hypothetical protein
MGEPGEGLSKLLNWMKKAGAKRQEVIPAVPPQPVKPQVPEPPKPERTPLGAAVDGMYIAQRASRGYSLVDVSALPHTQEEIAAEYARKYKASIIPLAELEENMPHTEKAATWIITGYSSDTLHTDRGAEDMNQRLVRALAFDSDSRGVRNEVIVLSNGMPDPEAFDVSLMWFNGPFEKESRGIWSIRPAGENGSGLEMIGYELGGGDKPAWEENTHQPLK